MEWKKYFLATSAVLTAVSVATPINAFGEGDTSDTDLLKEWQSVNRELSEVEDNLQKKQSEAEWIESKKQEVYEEWKRISLAEVELEIQMYQQTSDLLQVKERIYELELTEQELAEKIERRKRVIEKRLLAWQDYSTNMNWFVMLLNSESIGDFVNKAFTVTTIVESDTSIAQSQLDDIENYNNLKADAESELSDLRSLQIALERTQSELTEQKQKKDAYMNVLNTRYGWTNETLNDLQSQYAELNQQSTELQEEITERRKVEASVNQNNSVDSSTSVGSSETYVYSGTASNYDVRNVSSVTAEILDNNVLTGKLRGYGEVFYKVGHEYGIDPAFLAAIAMAETGGDSAWLRKYNNIGGFIYNGPMTFSSIEDSIQYMGSLLTRLYIRDGLYTVERIHSRYSPVGASNDPKNLNSNWVKNVYKFLGQAGVVA